MEQHNQEIGTRRDLVLYRLETARNDLKSARALFSIEDYKGANNRAYYAIFYAINAVHAVSGKAYKRHKDAVANFNKEYEGMLGSDPVTKETKNIWVSPYGSAD